MYIDVYFRDNKQQQRAISLVLVPLCFSRFTKNNKKHKDTKTKKNKTKQNKKTEKQKQTKQKTKNKQETNTTHTLEE
jgi:predicted nucleotidyltransferase